MHIEDRYKKVVDMLVQVHMITHHMHVCMHMLTDSAREIGERVRERLKLWSQPSYSFNTVAINHNQPRPQYSIPKTLTAQYSTAQTRHTNYAGQIAGKLCTQKFQTSCTIRRKTEQVNNTHALKELPVVLLFKTQVDF